MEEEVWKCIDNYINYEVSSFGNVRNIKFGKLLKFGVQSGEYFNVDLSKENKSKTFTIHRLVATAFIENPNNYTTVDHIDRNRQNNNVNNLRWANMVLQSNNRKDYRLSKSGFKNIYIDRGYYKVIKMFNNVKYQDNFTTIEDAKAYLDDILKNKLLSP